MSFTRPTGLYLERRPSLAAPESVAPTPVHTFRPSAEPAEIVLVMAPPLLRADAVRLCERVRVLLDGRGAGLIVCDVSAVTHADAGSIDVLARLALAARRLGSQVRLRDACGDLQELLALAGLADVLPCAAGLSQDEGDPADPTS
jgi:ABC-type transporter Mla MlaB component